MNGTSEAWRRVQEAARPVYERWSKERPEWMVTDSPLKYVDPARALEHTFAKYVILAQATIGAYPDVFEIGPGCAYLGELCSSNGWAYDGCDKPYQGLYADIQSRLGIAGVRACEVRRGEPVYAMKGRYSRIVGVQISWMNDWTADDLRFFVADCRAHLYKRGQIVMFPNPQAFNGADPVPLFAAHGAETINLPLLGRGFIMEAGL